LEVNLTPNKTYSQIW